MSPSLPSTPVPFPRPPTTWYYLPHVEKRFTKPQGRHRKQSTELFWMAEVLNSLNEAVKEEETGPKHWEEQRRKWTKDFASLDHYDVEEV